MTENEIYQLLFNNSWKCNEIQGIVNFIPTGADSFDIVKIKDGIETERNPFESIHYAMTNEEMDSPDNKCLRYFGYLNHYVYVLSDSSVKVHLPGINEFVLSKIDVQN